MCSNCTIIAQLCFLTALATRAKSFDLIFVPKTGKAGRSVKRILVDQMTAENYHPYAGPGALFIIRDCLLSKNPLMRTPDPRGTNRSKNDAVFDPGMANLPGRN